MANFQMSSGHNAIEQETRDGYRTGIHSNLSKKTAPVRTLLEYRASCWATFCHRALGKTNIGFFFTNNRNRLFPFAMVPSDQPSRKVILPFSSSDGDLHSLGWKVERRNEDFSRELVARWARRNKLHFECCLCEIEARRNECSMCVDRGRSNDRLGSSATCNIDDRLCHC